MSWRSQRTFWICVAASLALHAILLSELSGVIGGLPAPESPVLTAELEPAPPPLVAKPAPSTPAPVPKKQTAPKPPPIAPAPPPQDPAAAAATIPGMAEPPLPEQAERPSEAPESASTAEAQPEPVAAAPEPEPEASPEPDVPVLGDAPVADFPLPQKGKITYDVVYGSEKFSIGRSEQTWSIDKSSYRLTSHSETTGLVSLFRSYQYEYVSEGRVVETGLRPERFSARRGREGERQAMARFDWDRNELTYGSLRRPRTVPLQPGTYDFLSFIYQLAQTRLSPGRLQLSITTGTKLNRYILEVGAVEDVELPLGTMRAVPIRQIRIKDEESVQVWLAADPPQLPVRIRFLDRDGRMTVEQLASKIDFDGV